MMWRDCIAHMHGQGRPGLVFRALTAGAWAVHFFLTDLSLVRR